MSHSAPQTDLRAGSSLGRYELLLPIAKGGMAQVWAARLRGSRGFQKVVAIKTVLPDVMDNTRMERMFLEEAQLASQIHHPNVVGTLELGEHEGTLYLVMEWVDGEPLNQLMATAAASGGLPLPIGVNLIGQACQGLYAAHELRDDAGALVGLVHRDVSPQNLLVSFSGTAKLVDFGIAKATARSAGLTEAGEVKGKFAFMAPEQVRGHAVDARTDLFALGILLYSITTGKHPFRGAHPGETLQNICSDRPPTPPSAFLSDYPAALEAVVMKSLAKAPDQRFSSGNELLAALEDAMPEPLEASFEVEVARYLKEVFGPRVNERRAAIRVAQEQADRQRVEASSSSIGTLRAISIDRKDSGSFSVSTGSGPVPTLPSALNETPVVSRPGASKLAMTGVAVVLALGGGGYLLAGASTPTRGVAASGPVPAAVSLQAVVATSPPSAATVMAPTSVETLPLDAVDTPERKPARAQRMAGPVPKPPPAAPAAVAQSAPAPVTPAAVASAAPPVGSASAWDRGAFGGRH